MNFTDNLACVCLVACMCLFFCCMYVCDQVIKRGPSGRLCVFVYVCIYIYIYYMCVHACICVKNHNLLQYIAKQTFDCLIQPLSEQNLSSRLVYIIMKVCDFTIIIINEKVKNIWLNIVQRSITCTERTHTQKS